MVFQVPGSLLMSALWAGLSDSACSDLTLGALLSAGALSPRLYLLSRHLHVTFPALALVEASQLHDLHHVDESPRKL